MKLIKNILKLNPLICKTLLIGAHIFELHICYDVRQGPKNQFHYEDHWVGFNRRHRIKKYTNKFRSNIHKQQNLGNCVENF